MMTQDRRFGSSKEIVGGVIYLSSPAGGSGITTPTGGGHGTFD
jgi:hypothetical protein